MNHLRDAKMKCSMSRAAIRHAAVSIAETMIIAIVCYVLFVIDFL